MILGLMLDFDDFEDGILESVLFFSALSSLTNGFQGFQ